MKAALATIGCWTCLGAVGFAAGWWSAPHANPALASIVLKGVVTLFSAAAATLGLVFANFNSPPPTDLDFERQERWKRKMTRRWHLLWVRWAILILAGVGASLSLGILDAHVSRPENAPFIPDRFAIAFASAFLSVGILVIIKAVAEVIFLKRFMNEFTREIAARKRRQALGGTVPVQKKARA